MNVWSAIIIWQLHCLSQPSIGLLLLKKIFRIQRNIMMEKICDMSIRSKSKFLKLLSCILLISLVSTLQAQDNPVPDSFDIRKHCFVLPQALPAGKYYHSIGVLYVVVPKDWADNLVTAPMFSYSGKYTLPRGFNVQGSYSSLIISNRILMGPFWNFDFHENYHLGLGYQVAFNFGWLNQFGFNTYLTGWEQQPSITLGYNWKRTALTIRGDLYWTNALYITEGKNTIPYTNGFINGYSFTTSFDQRLYKEKVLSFGVKMNYVKYHVIAWPAFPVNNYRYWVPEFQLTLTF